MNAVGFEIPCPEAGVSRERCMTGCGVCPVAEKHHKTFRNYLEKARIVVFPTQIMDENTSMSTTAIIGESKNAVLLHWDSVNGGGTQGKIVFRYPASETASINPDELRVRLLNP